MAKYLGIENEPNWQALVDHLGTKRATYERMAELETEIELWQDGLGPKPKGVLIDTARTPAAARGMVGRLKKRARNHITTSN